MVGNPAAERAGDAVQDAVDRQGEGERRQGEAEQADRHVGDLEVVRDGRELRRRHQAAGSDQDEHQVEQPEQRRAQHLERRVVARRLRGRGGHRRVPRRPAARAAASAATTDDDALAEAEPQERRLVAADAITSWIGMMVNAEPMPKPAAVRPAARPRRSGNHFSALPMQVPKTRRRRCRPAPRRDRAADSESATELSDPGRGRPARRPPATTTLRPEAVDEPAFERHQPGLGQDEDGEGDLDRRRGPSRACRGSDGRTASSHIAGWRSSPCRRCRHATAAIGCWHCRHRRLAERHTPNAPLPRRFPSLNRGENRAPGERRWTV